MIEPTSRARRIAVPLIATAAFLALITVPAPAFAAKSCQGGTTAPPGNNSEVDQYYETVPNGCSDGPINPPSQGDGKGADGNSAAPVPVRTAAQLAGSGKDGRAALNLAQSGSPRTGFFSDHFQGGADSNDSGGGLGDFLRGIVGAAGGSGAGIGWLLPLLLAAIAIGGIFFLLGRRRRSQPS